MRCGEGGVIGRMPVLGCEGVGEGFGQQPVDQRDDGAAVGDRKLAAGHEGRLHIGRAEDVGGGVERDHRGFCLGGFVLSG
jgi:hypothetical protein